MNKSKFDATLKSTVSSHRVNVTLLSDWFARTLEALNSLSEQQSAIPHPGYRGQSREELLSELLEPMLPESLHLTKGFAVDRLLGMSKEQDLMVLSRNSAMSLMPRRSCFPIHSCLASIEVKSNLNIGEIRKAILNCVSVKKRLRDLPTKTMDEDPIGQYCYAIFAYTSRRTLEGVAGTFNEALVDVPHCLRPNLVYILGRGMLIPSESKTIQLALDQMFQRADFRPVPNMGAPPSIPATEAYAFLWFVTNIIDHCLRERERRPAFLFREYWETVLMLQERIVNRKLRTPPGD